MPPFPSSPPPCGEGLGVGVISRLPACHELPPRLPCGELRRRDEARGAGTDRGIPEAEGQGVPRHRHACRPRRLRPLLGRGAEDRRMARRHRQAAGGDAAGRGAGAARALSRRCARREPRRRHAALSRLAGDRAPPAAAAGPADGDRAASGRRGGAEGALRRRRPDAGRSSSTAGWRSAPTCRPRRSAGWCWSTRPSRRRASSTGWPRG